jgi:hypothetical protein
MTSGASSKEQIMSEEASVIGLNEATRFQRDLYLYWREAHTSAGAPLTSRGYVTRPALRRIRTALACGMPGGGQRGEAAADLAEGEDLRLFFLRRLLERLGLLRADADGSRLATCERGEMARFLAHPLAERLRICARLWVAGGWWLDRPDPNAAPPRLLAPSPPRIALARRRALEMLGSRAPGELVAIPPPPLRGAKGVRSRGRRLGRDTLERAASADSDGETLRAALLGPLAWMGFVALEATGGSAEPAACRAGVGLRALAPGDDMSALSEQSGRVVMLADLSLVAYPPLTAPLLLTLDSCAEAIALDVVARYRLTREALSRTHHAGWSAAEVALRLEALSGAALPANVRTTLADWERHVERLRLTPNVSVLEAPTPALLDALLADRVAREWVERRLTPMAALLVPGRVPQVREWLLRRGELPALLRADGA